MSNDWYNCIQSYINKNPSHNITIFTSDSQCIPNFQKCKRISMSEYDYREKVYLKEPGVYINIPFVFKFTISQLAQNNDLVLGENWNDNLVIVNQNGLRVFNYIKSISKGTLYDKLSSIFKTPSILQQTFQSVKFGILNISDQNFNRDEFLKYQDESQNFNQDDKLQKFNQDELQNISPHITIVMAYHNRKSQLLNTLTTLKFSNYKNFDVVIVDDASDDDISFIVDRYKFPITLVTIGKDDKTWVNPCVVFNRGITKATGDIILLQSPECIHVGDCLSYIAKNLTIKNYITLACIAETNSNDKIWYNHKEYNPRGLHFASAIYKSNIDKLGGGFDEDYAKGYCFDDNDFVEKVKELGLEVEILDDKVPYVVHQYHEPAPYVNCGENKESVEYELWYRNYIIFKQKHPNTKVTL